MNADHEVLTRLQDADGLTEILAAARDAFEWMLPVLEAREDPAGAMFAAIVMAGAAAADGRDAVAFAPSCPPAPRTIGGPHAPGGPSAAPDPDSDAGNAATAVTAICALLAARLAGAGSSAPDRGDQIACTDAGEYAGKIRRLLARAGP